jgi:hypothetical protein
VSKGEKGRRERDGGSGAKEGEGVPILETPGGDQMYLVERPKEERPTRDQRCCSYSRQQSQIV